MTEPDVEQCDYRQGRQRCLRPAGHVERHRFAPTKELQVADEPAEATAVANTPVTNTTVTEPDTKPPIAHALSRVDNDLLIAWDTCGNCGLHITICACPSGPREPDWVKRFLDRNQPGVSALDLVERRAKIVEATTSTVGSVTVEPDPEEGHS